MKRSSPAIVLVALALSCGHANGIQVAGWAEYARLEPSGIQLQAKLDTGAENSSANASAIEIVVLDGEEQVRFTITNETGESIELLRPIVRYAKVKRHFGSSQRRPVVRLMICVGESRKEAEVNLVDRSGFDHALLIGRSFLAGQFLVDPANTHRLDPECGGARPD